MTTPKTFFEFSPSLHFGVAVGLGLMNGFSTYNMTAAREEVPTTLQDLISVGVGSGGQYIFPSNSGQQMRVVSTSVSDVTDLKIIGLDEDWLEQTETITLNGTTPVTSTKLWSRINQLTNNGTANYVGEISIQNTAGTVTYTKIINGDRSYNGVFSTPLNKYSFVLSIIDGLTKDTGSEVAVITDLKVRIPGGVFVSEFRKAVQRGGSSSESLVNLLPIILPPGTDFKYSVIAGGAGTSYLVRTAFLLVEDHILERVVPDA